MNQHLQELLMVRIDGCYYLRFKFFSRRNFQHIQSRIPFLSSSINFQAKQRLHFSAAIQNATVHTLVSLTYEYNE